MAGGILDPKSIQERLNTLVNQQVDQQVEGKEPPAKLGAAQDPFAGFENPAAKSGPEMSAPPAAAAPSAPAAGGTKPPAEPGPRGKIIYVDDLSLVPDGEVAVWGANMNNYMTGTRTPGAGQANAAYGKKEWIGIPTKRSPSVFLSDADLQDPKFAELLDGQLNAIGNTLASGRDVYFPSAGIGTGRAALATSAPSVYDSLVQKLEILGIYNSPEDGGDIDSSGVQNVTVSNAEIRDVVARNAGTLAQSGPNAPQPAQRATSVGMAPGDAGTPAPGETTPSVAPTGLPEAPVAPGQAPETQVTATTPPDPFAGVTDPSLTAGGVPAEDAINMPAYELPKTGGRRIGVIGTAGRKEKAARLTAADFDAMVAYLAKAVQPNDTLVSGGAAWADHSAVRAFLDGKVAGLVLHLPAELVVGEDGKVKFDDAGFGTVGAAANYYHKQFATKLGMDPDATLKEIQAAIDKGASVTYGDGTSSTTGADSGFKKRNSLIAQDADYGLIAFDFDVSDRKAPADGGTGDTWRKHGKQHGTAKRRLVDIRGISADPAEGDRVNAYNEVARDRADRKVEVARLERTVRALDIAQDAKISLLGKLTGTGKSGIPSDRNIDDVISAIDTFRRKTVTTASARAYLPVQKLVSAAILVAMADTGRIPAPLREMVARGEIPNLAGELPQLDPEAALRFLRVRALQHSVERGTGDNARDADRILHEVLLSVGVPEEALQPRSPYRPYYTTLKSTQEDVVKTEQSNNRELGTRLQRIKSTSAKLGALLSHPEIAKPLFTITELLRGVEFDIASERTTLPISRLRQDPVTRMPFLRAVEQVDPVYDYINAPEYLLQRVEVAPDPYVTALALVESRALPPQTMGEGDFAYDEAQLKGSYKSVISGSTAWRRYAFDIGGEVDPNWMAVDENGLVTDKFDGFQNTYADYATPPVTYGVPVSRNGVSSRSRYNRSRATIGMHVSTDASAGIGWGNRQVDLEVHVVRALKKLMADVGGTDIMPDTADELAIIKSGFIPYTTEAKRVTGTVKNVTTAVNAALGQVYLVDVDGINPTPDDPTVLVDASGSYIQVGDTKYYTGKGFYAFREGDPAGDALLDTISRFTGESSSSRRTNAFNIGSPAISYPKSVTDRIQTPDGADTSPIKMFRVTVDPVVHQTFMHNEYGSPLVRADGRPFQGDYRLSPERVDEYIMVDSAAQPSHAYDDSNEHLIEFDEGIRFAVSTEVPKGLTVDGVSLEEDYLDEPDYLTRDNQQPLQLATEASKAADRQRLIESGAPVGGDISPTGRALEYEAAAGGETQSHFGQTYGFDELDTSAPDAAAYPLRSKLTRMQARARERMGQLGVSGDVSGPAATPATFDVQDFIEAESLSPENAALAKQLLLDYMWILRLRVRDASQATPRDKVRGDTPDRSTFMDHREVAFRRGDLIKSTGFPDLLALHNASTRGPASLGAVISELMLATGDDPVAANEILSETYKEVPAEDPAKMFSSREGKFTYHTFEPRTPLETYANILADELRKTMAVERGADPAFAFSLDRLIGDQETALDAQEGIDSNVQGAQDVVGVESDVQALLALQPGTPEYEQRLGELQAKVSGTPTEVTQTRRYTTTSGVEIAAETPAGHEVLDDIIARDKAGKLTETILNNATANMQREDAAWKKKNGVTVDNSQIATSKQPGKTLKPTIRESGIIDFIRTSDPATLRNLVMRAWAKYAEHMAADGDYDSFVNVIRNGIRKKDQMPKLLNFVLDKVGAVRLPDNWFTMSDGTITFPVPKVKNPKYESSARRVDARQGVLDAAEMSSFVAEAVQAGTLKRSAAERLRAVIRFVEQSNEVMSGKGESDKLLGFHVVGEGDSTRIIVTTSPTYASQKTASSPYRATESGESDWTTFEDRSGRLQKFSAADMQKIISAVGADGILTVRELPVAEGGILAQARGIATDAEVSAAAPYVIEFTDGTSVDSMVDVVSRDALDLRAGKTPKEAIIYRLLDASVRARFFGLMKGVLDSAGVTEEVITAEDLDTNPFEAREVKPTEDTVRRRMEAGQTEADARKTRTEYVLRPSVEGLQSYEGPFSRARHGGSATLRERPYGNRVMSPQLKAIRDQLKLGKMALAQEDADTLGTAIDRVIEHKQNVLAHADSMATSGKPRFSPGAKAGIAGGALAGTIAAFLQYGADEKAKDAAIASLPSQVAFEALGAVPKVGGPLAAATGLGLTYATGGDMLRAIIGIGGSIAGGVAGGALGLVSGPGAFAAGLAGSTAGYMLADNIYSAVTGKSNTSPMPANVADSNPIRSASMEVPTRNQVNQEAPLPAVNKDIAALERMGG